MGAVLVPLLVGLDQAPGLPHASSLCRRVYEACPVNIPLHELLLELRRDLVEGRIAPRSERLGSRCGHSHGRRRLATGSARCLRASDIAGPRGSGPARSGRATAHYPRCPQTLSGRPMSDLIEQFIANAERNGLIVHRGAIPSFPTPARRARSTASPTRAAWCSRRRRPSRAQARCCPMCTSQFSRSDSCSRSRQAAYRVGW